MHPALPAAPHSHRIVCLALPGVVAFDLATACESFRFAQHENGRPCYQVSVCAEQDELDAGPYSLRLHHGLELLDKADTIIVPGVALPMAPLSPPVIRALRAAAARGIRIASICSGAFVLAEAGLLDGLRATTHWKAAAELQARYPDVEVDPGVLFVDNGMILTSAGAAAGIDLCLYMIRQDVGAAIAAHVARLSVVPLQRDGGQQQFIPPTVRSTEKSLQPLLAWATANLHQPLSLPVLARQAHTSARTLLRRFQQEHGMSPAQWLIRARVRRAQALLESSALSVEQIVGEVGLGSAANFRQQFQRIVGISPQRYRRSFSAMDMGMLD
ncbi:helix-turn-helix domain-containing protein [Stenotrophomonas maltophilia]|uniref:GlxA family transcriptional regulator n=1 Tax=Stenotrophomonas maltophilia TaxID=40324 RepID=UPI001076A02E|nr:helix-turn-helix domain-containing protein [Stenotrophomonas maltophilia]TFZ45102.1 helix-turn-helix domain-containing protein [Stenotrophomonas maltophilia]